MLYKRFFLISVTTLITTSLQSTVVLPGILPAQQVLAQATEARKAEADRLRQQGSQQLQANQLEAALQSFQKTLTIYRDIKNRRGEGVALAGLGLVYYGLKDYLQAINYYKQSLIIAREIKDSKLEALVQKGLAYAQLSSNPQKAKADRLLNQGIQQAQASQFKAAFQSWEQALQIYREINDRASENATLGNMGIAYYSLGDYKKAIEFHQQSFAIAKQIGDQAGIGHALGNLGNAYVALGNYKKAIEFHQQRLAIAREIKDRRGEGKSLGNLGVVYDSLGNYTKAIEYHQQLLAIAREIKDRQSEGKALGNLGVAYLSLGNYPKAIEYHQQSLAIARKIKDRQGESASLGNLGIVYRLLGNYTKAIEYHQQSLAIAREIKDRQGEGKALENLGVAYLSLGNYPKAIEYHQQSLAIAREIKNRQSEGKALGNLGIVYRLLGNYPKAIEYHQQSLAIARKIKNRQSEGKALGNLGIVYDSLGNYPKAIEYHQQSLAIAREIKDRQGEGASLGNLGIVYRLLGNYPKAIEYNQQSLAIAREIKDRQGEGTSLGNLGLAYYSLGNYSKAIEYQQKLLAIAREIKDRQSEGKALGNLGLAYLSLGNYPKAIDHSQQWLVIAREIKDHQSEGKALNNLGFAYYKQGKLTLAESTLMEGMKVYESLRGRELKDSEKVSFFDTQRSAYLTSQKVLIAQNKTNAALEISERGRGRAFVELLASRLSTKSQKQSPKPPNIAEIKQIAKAQNATLVQYSIIYDEFKLGGRKQVKESELYIWVIKPTGEVTFRKADLKHLWKEKNTTLDRLISTSRMRIGAGRGRGGIVASANPDATPIKTPLQQLHKILIKDITDLLPKNPKDRVIFIPQESLFLVPFPALRDESGKYLIEKHTILTAPSIQVLDFTRKNRIKTGKSLQKQKALIVGNPEMPIASLEIGGTATKLPPLEGSEREAKEIAQLLQTKAILGKNATKANILQRISQADIIHFATHGWADSYQGLGSWIALAPNNQGNPQKDDGLLTADEILDLKLKAQLVVLSACETGKGRLTGDGVIGLSRSLISAGVPSVMVSLWLVDDKATQYLMVEFYKSLQTQPDKALALREAMLKTKKKYPSPGNWAAFTLIGER